MTRNPSSQRKGRKPTKEQSKGATQIPIPTAPSLSAHITKLGIKNKETQKEFSTMKIKVNGKNITYRELARRQKQNPTKYNPIVSNRFDSILKNLTNVLTFKQQKEQNQKRRLELQTNRKRRSLQYLSKTYKRALQQNVYLQNKNQTVIIKNAVKRKNLTLREIENVEKKIKNFSQLSHASNTHNSSFKIYTKIIWQKMESDMKEKIKRPNSFNETQNRKYKSGDEYIFKPLIEIMLWYFDSLKQNKHTTYGSHINFLDQHQMYHFMALLFVDLLHDTSATHIKRWLDIPPNKKIGINGFYKFLKNIKWFPRDILPNSIEEFVEVLNESTTNILQHAAEGIERHSQKKTINYLHNLNDSIDNPLKNNRKRNRQVNFGFGKMRCKSNGCKLPNSGKLSIVFDQSSTGASHKIMGNKEYETCVSIPILADKGLSQADNETNSFFVAFKEFFLAKSAFGVSKKQQFFKELYIAITKAKNNGLISNKYADHYIKFIKSYIGTQFINNINTRESQVGHCDFTKDMVRKYNLNLNNKFISRITYQNRDIFTFAYYCTKNAQPALDNIKAALFNPNIDANLKANQKLNLNKSFWNHYKVISAPSAKLEKNISNALFKTIGDLGMGCYASATNSCVCTGDVSAANLHIFLSELKHINKKDKNTGITINNTSTKSGTKNVEQYDFIFEAHTEYVFTSLTNNPMRHKNNYTAKNVRTAESGLPSASSSNNEPETKKPKK